MNTELRPVLELQGKFADLHYVDTLMLLAYWF